MSSASAAMFQLQTVISPDGAAIAPKAPNKALLAIAVASARASPVRIL